MWFIMLTWHYVSFLNMSFSVYVAILITGNTRTMIKQNVWKFRNILFNFFHSIIQHYVFTLHFHHGFDWFLTSWKCYESMFWKYFEHQNVLVLTWTLTTLIGKSHRHQESWFLTPPKKNHTTNTIFEHKTWHNSNPMHAFGV